MSRGPGHVATAIAGHLAAHPNRVFTIGELATIAYPGVPIEKKHRVAAARVVKKLAPGRLKRRETGSPYTPDPATDRRLTDLHRAANWIGNNGDIATLTFLRDELKGMRNMLAFQIALKRYYGDP
jgi:hypothetical protein